MPEALLVLGAVLGLTALYMGALLLAHRHNEHIKRRRRLLGGVNGIAFGLVRLISLSDDWTENALLLAGAALVVGGGIALLLMVRQPDLGGGRLEHLSAALVVAGFVTALFFHGAATLQLGGTVVVAGIIYQNAP